jgi:hypothetical protein
MATFAFTWISQLCSHSEFEYLFNPLSREGVTLQIFAFEFLLDLGFGLFLLNGFAC